MLAVIFTIGMLAGLALMWPVTNRTETRSEFHAWLVDEEGNVVAIR